jgi:hypothetical protein
MAARYLSATHLVVLLAFHVPAQQSEPGSTLHLRVATFDPRAQSPHVPLVWRAADAGRLWLVQLREKPDDAARAAIAAAGGELHGYVPDHAYVVRMDLGIAARIGRLRAVRWVGRYEPFYRVDPVLRAAIEDPVDERARQRVHVVVVDKRVDKPGLVRAIEQVGGTIDHEEPGSILLTATLGPSQLRAIAHRDEVLWIDAAGPTGTDMDNARIQTGANWVEQFGGYTGLGIRGHVYEGLDASHSDFTFTPINVQSCGASFAHGHATAGIVFGNGTSHPSARGMAPNAQALYTDFTCVTPGVSRWQVVRDLVNLHDAMFTTAAWGSARTTFYTSISASSDDIVFDHDILWTQAFGESSRPEGRPEAWAKNVVAVGGVVHFDNADPADDSWLAGGASSGPAADGRQRPDLCAYYDQVWTSDLTGAAGFGPLDHFSGFGGTSAATPIVAGSAALAIQMFTDALFNNPLRVPGGTRFQNRPHASTLRALLIASARQYAFTAQSRDNRREHQGWGFPDVRILYDNRARTTIVDETDLLVQGQTRSYTVVANGREPELKAVLCWTDPAGNPAAALARTNDLELRVTSPGGAVYHGNYGLSAGTHSTPGGSADTRNTVECVFARRPEPGAWRIEVTASLIAVDGHVETAAIDADYGLVVAFGDDTGSYRPLGAACPGSGGTPSLHATGLPRVGASFGLELDRARANAAAPLAVGVSDKVWLGGPLPFGFGALGAPLCALFVSTEILVPFTTDAAGQVRVGIAVPATPALVGAGAFPQFLVLDPGANLAGLVSTNALAVAIGR